ncbi:hypothetical protein DAI22_12g207501 [Oryza sativa Japonica Group]|nr:hypothetical protein DAI22_12g207501 [Oryza sativa Japonica Group]KAF2908774.1 hypothetical protein DAI22_12g207501 [Oryza sativa Japonica Group]
MDISAYGSDRNRSVTTSNNTSYNTAFQKMRANAEANLCSFRFSFSVQCMHQICSSDKSNTPNNHHSPQEHIHFCSNTPAIIIIVKQWST